MTTTATITDIQTGATKVLPVDWQADDVLWRTGNYDCDCNLGLLLGINTECGDSRFEVEVRDDRGLVWRRGIDGNEYDRELLD